MDETIDVSYVAPKAGDKRWTWSGAPLRRGHRRSWAEAVAAGSWRQTTLAHDPLHDGERWVVLGVTEDGMYDGFFTLKGLHRYQCVDPMHDGPCSEPDLALPPDPRPDPLDPQRSTE